MTSIASLITDHTALTLLITTSLLAVAMLALYPNNLLKYLQRKRYQYEVTFSLYMMTPTEKFIFSTFVFLVSRVVLSFLGTSDSPTRQNCGSGSV